MSADELDEIVLISISRLQRAAIALRPIPDEVEPVEEDDK